MRRAALRVPEQSEIRLGRSRTNRTPPPPVVPPRLDTPTTIANRFLSADRGVRRAHLDHRRHRVPSLSLEIRRMSIHPTAAAVASLIWPWLIVPKSSDSQRIGNPLCTGISPAMPPQNDPLHSVKSLSSNSGHDSTSNGWSLDNTTLDQVLSRIAALASMVAWLTPDTITFETHSPRAPEQGCPTREQGLPAA